MKKLSNRDQLLTAIEALDSLAEWEHTDRVTLCDEPGSVICARMALGKIRYGTFRAELPEGQNKPEERGEC